MNGKKVLAAAFATGLWAGPAWALQHQMACDAKGQLKSYLATGNGDSSQIKDGRIHLTDPVDSYYSNRDGDYSVEKIKSVIEQALKNKVDPYYALSLVAIENPGAVKKDPIKDSSDPNSTPPLTKTELREKGDGLIPLDAIGILDAFDCQVESIPFADRKANRASHYLLKTYPGNEELYKKVVALDAKRTTESEEVSKTKEQILNQMTVNALSGVHQNERNMNHPDFRRAFLAQVACFNGMKQKQKGFTISSCRAIARPPEKLKRIKIQSGVKSELCMPAVLPPAGSSPSLQWTWALKGKTPEVQNYFHGCCVQVEAPADANPAKLMDDVRNLVGFNFIKDRIDAGLAVSRNLGISDPALKMATVFQAYNGFGQIGGSIGEQANSCLNDLDLKKNPVYGAGTGELALNMFLRDSQIRNWVAEAAHGNSVPSVFCAVLGSGQHQFSDTQFAQIQKKSFSGRNCPSHSYEAKRTNSRRNSESGAADTK